MEFSKQRISGITFVQQGSAMGLQFRLVELPFITRRHENHRGIHASRCQLLVQLDTGHAAKLQIHNQTPEPPMLDVSQQRLARRIDDRIEA